MSAPGFVADQLVFSCKNQSITRLCAEISCATDTVIHTKRVPALCPYGRSWVPSEMRPDYGCKSGRAMYIVPPTPPSSFPSTCVSPYDSNVKTYIVVWVPVSVRPFRQSTPSGQTLQTLFYRRFALVSNSEREDYLSLEPEQAP